MKIDALRFKNRWLKLVSIVIILTMIALYVLLFPADALAVAAPDTTPTISGIKANRNLIETGDVLIYGDYDLPYASPPSEPSDDTYIIKLLDGSSELAVITPYVYFDNGYNEGVFAFYFSASDNLTWGDLYTIRITQNPIYFSSPSSWDYSMTTSSYTSQTTQSANQLELAVNITTKATALEAIYTDYTLLEDSTGGTVLSSPSGETYFRGAIYGIQAMAPTLFVVQVMNIDRTQREWGTDQYDEYRGRFDDTWVGDAEDATANQFNLTKEMIFSLIFILPICIGAIIVSNIKFKKSEPGYVFSSLALTMGALMGWMPMAVYGAILQCEIIYIAYLWHYARSS